MREQRGLSATSFTRRASLLPQERTYYDPGSRHHAASNAAHIGYSPGRTYVTTRSGMPGYNEVDYEDEDPRSRSSAVVRQRPYTRVERVRIRETDDLPVAAQRRPRHPLVYVGVSLIVLLLFITAYTYHTATLAASPVN